MPYAKSGNTRLYYEDSGRGTPIVFVHEFSGDLRSWEDQVRHFSRRHRCIAFNARGYPPSEVPQSWTKYSQAIATDDIAAVMRHLGLRKAHIIGCSMGAAATLHFGLRYPHMAQSLTLIGAGSGSDPKKRKEFLRNTAARAQEFETLPLQDIAKTYRNASNRVQLLHKDPRAWREFWRRFCEHSGLGHANTLRGIQMRRPAIQSLERGLRRLKVPLHVVVGDEDESALDAGLFIKRSCAAARLTVVPATGHVVNLEEPAHFNRITDEFLALVETRRWRPRAGLKYQ
ncbi:MAG: alpha/beta hydrolase [Burkholderiales bacterium]|nr:alpha/beta hydrolase [Burkholderiales bacterium]